MAKITNPLDSPRLLGKVSSIKTAYSGISIVASVLLLRFFIAFEWLTSSTSKLQSILATPDTYLGRFPTVFSNVWAKDNPYPFMVDFLKGIAAPNAATAVTIIAIGELIVGISLLIGLLTRISTVVPGVAMNVIFLLAAGHTSPSTAGVNLVMIGAQLTLFFLSSGRIMGVDGILRRKVKNPLW